MSKPLVIYHANCADGFGAAYVFWKLYGDNGADYIPASYQKDPPDVTDREVFLVDFSYKKEKVIEMASRAFSITHIDHHKSAIEDLAPLVEAGTIESFCNLEKSGAVLAYLYLYGKTELPEIVGENKQILELLNYIQDRDLWKFEYPETRDIMAAIYSYPMEFETWDFIMTAPEMKKILLTEGFAINRRVQKDVETVIKTTKRDIHILGDTVPLINCPPGLVSEALNLINVDQPFAASYFDTISGRNFSLRSQPNKELSKDVSEIAKVFGGGGHKHAAGFVVPRYHPFALC